MRIERGEGGGVRAGGLGLAREPLGVKAVGCGRGGPIRADLLRQHLR